jgi:hypothetical protein
MFGRQGHLEDVHTPLSGREEAISLTDYTNSTWHPDTTKQHGDSDRELLITRDTA